MTRARDKRRRRSRRLLALGVAAVVVVAVIGYISYTANSGLPWQDVYSIDVEVPNANRLNADADVRVGGIRVGQVADVAGARRDGRAFARVRVDLEPDVAPVPADTTVKVRSASVLGATYLELTLGDDEAVPEGGTLPLARATRTVELNDLLSVFDRATAHGVQETIGGLAYGFAGRGTAVNATTGSLARLMPSLTRVAQLLADPRTGLEELIEDSDAAMSALAPVSAELAGLVRGGAATFGALARERAALRAAIEAAPPTEEATRVALRRVRPALDGLARLAVDLRPAGRMLPATLRDVNSTLAAGRRSLRMMPPFARRLGSALGALRALSTDRFTVPALRKLTDLAIPTNEVLDILVPAQVHCNAVALWGIDFSNAFSSLGTGHGPSLPALIVTSPGAENEALQNARPSPNVGINPYPNVNEDECEAGNEPWTGRQQINNPPGLQSGETRDTDPPPLVRDRARAAGLLDDPKGSGR